MTCQICLRELGANGHRKPGLSYDCVKIGYEREKARADTAEAETERAWRSNSMNVEVLAVARRERDAARAALNTPELHDFAKGVVVEAAHQRERWGSDHDGGKEPSDWFWLVGYLAGKALHSHAEHNAVKALHHTITAAAALANWHAAILGKTNMRPGIEPPALAAPADGLYVCEHCPDHPHPLNDDGTKCKFPRPAPAAETGKAEVSNVIGRAPDLVGLPCGCLKDRFNQYIARCLRHPPPEQIATPAPAQGLLIAARAAPPERGSR